MKKYYLASIYREISVGQGNNIHKSKLVIFDINFDTLHADISKETFETYFIKLEFNNLILAIIKLLHDSKLSILCKQVQFEYWLMIDNIKKGQSHFRHGIPAKGKNHSTMTYGWHESRAKY